MKADSFVPTATAARPATGHEQFRLRVSRARHDLRKSLGQILGFSEMLLDELGEPGRAPLQPDLETVNQTANHILAQLDDSLDASKIESGLADLARLQRQVPKQSSRLVTAVERLTRQAAALPDDDFKSDLARIASAARRTLEVAGTSLADLRAPTAAETTLAPASPPSHPLADLRAPSPAPSLSALARKEGVILVVDDLEENRALLARLLSRLGYAVRLAESGQHALDFIAVNAVDLVLLDILMPGLDGLEVLRRLKAAEATQHLPVVMLSSADQIDIVVRCIKLGADDFLPKPFNATLLMARIESSLSKKRLRDQERRTYQALLESRERLAAELADAAAYVRSLLPLPIEGEVAVRWRFQPSQQLGGDIFGYHWVNEGRLAIYLLDVCGHGVGAALLSVSVLNVLRAQSLAEADFCNPASVLGHLNRVFQMDQQNNLIFTIWYGVFDQARRQLAYASGGHPPAALIECSAGAPPRARQLSTAGRVIGCDPVAEYRSDTCAVSRGSKLYVFSDGVYEILRPDGRTLQLPDLFEQLSQSTSREGTSKLDDIIAWTKSVRGEAALEDDLSIMEVIL